MFRLSKKFATLRLSIFALLIASTLAIVGGLVAHKLVNNTHAASEATVTYSSDRIRYGGENNDASYTPYFYITVGDDTYTGYCLEPHWLPADSGSSATIRDNFASHFYGYSSADYTNAILLLMYIDQSDSPEAVAARQVLFNTTRTPNRDKRYAWTHAIISAMIPLVGDSQSGTYGGSYWLLSDDDADYVDRVIGQTLDYIDDDAPVWQKASQGDIYYLWGYDLNQGQDFGWAVFPPEEIYGSIKVKKCDAETEACTPQGNANLQGIKFEVYNGSVKIAEDTTDASGEVTFSNLPSGTYTVKEVSSNTTYNLDTASGSGQSATIATDGETKTLTFYDTVKKGQITVSKNDAEKGSCNTLGSASFVGNKFQIINKSTNPIRYGSSTIAVNGVVDTKTLAAGQCSVTFEDLPYGTYDIKETAVGTGYILNSGTQSATIPTGGSTSISKTFSNQVIRGNVKFVKKDTVADSAMANVVFQIESNTTHEKHNVVSNASGVVDTSATAHSTNTNGFDSIADFNNVTYRAHGTWFGGTTVNDSLGALPYDTYTVTELSCLANQHCTSTGRTKSFTINTNSTTVDLGNWENTCNYTISTKAYDGTNTNTDKNDVYIENTTSATVKDEVTYCGAANTTYQIEGKLINKKNDAVINTLSATNVTTGSNGCGTTTVSYSITAAQLANLKGTDLVVYEYLKKGNKTLASHENKNDANQTVTVVSLRTTAKDTDVNGDEFVETSNNATIYDEIAYCLTPGKTYTISGEVYDITAGSVIKTGSKELALAANANACGTTTMTFTGVNAVPGHKLVVHETAKIGNTTIVSHVNDNDLAQTLYVISLGTTAKDADANGDEYVEESENATIYDKINYCLAPGRTYTIVGEVYDVTAGTVIKTLSKELALAANANACGDTEMVFTGVNAVEGHKLVVHEAAKVGNSTIINHANNGDTAQTLYVISLGTTAKDVDANGDEYVEASDNATIYDNIAYCLAPGRTYTVVGEVYDVTAGSVIKTESKELTLAANADACGNIEMVFTGVNAVAGHKLVVHEAIKVGNSTIITHADDNDTAQTLYVISLGTTAKDTDANGDEFVETSDNANVYDNIAYCLAPGRTYTVVGEVYDITADSVIKTESQELVLAADADACGNTEMTFSGVDAVAGHTIVVHESVKVGNSTIITHANNEDTAQTLYVISLGTTATDTHDGDHIIYNAITESNIKDTIDYCLKANEHYTIKGILMNKATNQPLLVNGSEITATKEINPTTPCGTTSMIFDIDVTWLGGTEVVVFETVEHNNRDIISHEDINDEAQTIDIVSLSTLATDDSDGDHIIFDEQEAKIRDVVDYCLIPGKTYTIKSVIMDSKNGLPLKINGEKIEASTVITPTKNCDYVELYFDIDPAEIAGRNIVMFEDLYYDNKLVLEHNTLFDKYETINVLSLSTTATDLEDGDKLMAANKQVTITDKVDYCLLEDETFTIKGVVMNKTTKEILLINGAPVEQTITITPEEKCGSVNMEYTLDTTGLGGAELIIFESLYYDDERILAHEDFNNAPETVSVLVPTPDTGLFTKADWEDKEEQIAPVISIVAVALPVAFLIIGFGVRKNRSRHHIDFD